MYRGMNGGWINGGVPFMGNWGGLVMMVLLAAALAIGIVAIVRSGKARYAKGSSASERGLQILTERFANGEIDAEKFRSMKAELDTTN
jgi:putative membrane protein